jgi:4-hydroxy 2-oxovalerate aldolase
MGAKLLDCTLRDGGYYTNWDFSESFTRTYFESLNKLPVEWVEIGYRSLPQNVYYGEYFYCPDYVLKQIKKSYNGKIAIMLNEKDVKPEHVTGLLSSAKGYVDMIRLAVDPKNLKRAIDLAKEIKKLKFLVSLNIMYMSKWKNQPEFLDNLKYADGVADYLYMVDSYGGIYPAEVIETINIVKERINIPICFHGHNNMELAFINSLTAVENGAEMIDATITGIGRGAGNLKTELLMTALNSKEDLPIDFNVLSEIVHEVEELKEKYKWGTNLPYMVSGANSLPQKDVMEWVSKRFYSYNSIIRALHNLKDNKKDNERFEIFHPQRSSENVLIIGGGPSAVERCDAIRAFLESNPDITVIHSSSRNAGSFKGIKNNQYFCLVGNEGNRLEKVFKDLGDFQGTCILPGYPRKMGTYVPPAVFNKTKELGEVIFTDELKDTHTAIALQTAINLQAKNIYVAGYDGYANALISNKELELFNENEMLFRNFVRFTGIELFSLTPTLYKTLKPDSIYAKL